MTGVPWSRFWSRFGGIPPSHSITLEKAESLGSRGSLSHSIILHHTQSHFPRSPFTGPEQE